MQRWIGKRIVALLDSLVGVVVFAVVAALLPVSFVLQAIILGTFLLVLWVFVEGKEAWPTIGAAEPASPRVAADLELLNRYETDPREIEFGPRDLGPAPPPSPSPPPKGRVVVSPVELWDLERFGVPDSVAGPPLPGAGRNDPCWCGSGKKYKRCHGA